MGRPCKIHGEKYQVNLGLPPWVFLQAQEMAIQQKKTVQDILRESLEVIFPPERFFTSPMTKDTPEIVSALTPNPVATRGSQKYGLKDVPYLTADYEVKQLPERSYEVRRAKTPTRPAYVVKTLKQKDALCSYCQRIVVPIPGGYDCPECGKIKVKPDGNEEGPASDFSPENPKRAAAKKILDEAFDETRTGLRCGVCCGPVYLTPSGWVCDKCGGGTEEDGVPK